MLLTLSGTDLDDGEPVTELIVAARELQISWVELWYPRNTLHAGVGPTLARLEEAGLRVACISTGSELYRDGGSPEDQALLVEAIKLARRCGARLVNTYFGYAPVQDDNKAIATYHKYLRPCLEAARSAGVTIVLENEFNAFGVDVVSSDLTRRPSVLRRLFLTLNSPSFRLNFDACNFFCAGVDPFPTTYELLAPFIAYTHLKDAKRSQPEADQEDLDMWNRYRDFDREYVTCPIGAGSVPWDALLGRMAADGYNGFITLEPHSARCHLRHAWAQAAAFVRRHFSAAAENGS
jgi:sugar phosphate isomerase/epimerase